jgi:hypothetical protein
LYHLLSRFKHVLFAAALLLLLSVMSLAAPQAHAASLKQIPQTHQISVSVHSALASISCTYAACDDLNPLTRGCANNSAAVRTVYFPARPGTPISGGLINLVFSYSCHAAWAYIQFDNAMPGGYAGDATIVASDHQYSCFDAGGNGEVEPGQHSCYSGMVSDGPWESAFATGSYTDYSQSTTYAINRTNSF